MTKDGYDSDNEQIWKEEDFTSKLHMAVGENEPDIENIKVLIKEEGVDIRNIAFQQTPAHIAAADGKVEILELLKQHKADLNAVDDFESTVLEYAVEAKHKEATQFLLDNGANVQPDLVKRVEALTGIRVSQVEKPIGKWTQDSDDAKKQEVGQGSPSRP